ncbi:MAG: YbfB/YjiJ family MFS transporter [Actinomycetota bacterium]
MPRPISDRTIALALTLVPFASIGLARFAFGLVLPAMRDELGWSYFDGGVATTANAAGYLAGAIYGARAARRFGDRTMIVWGTAGMALTLFATALSEAIAPILVFRFGAGLFGGLAFVAGGTLATQLSKTTVPSALVWYPGGAGLAIFVTALGLPPIEDAVGGWRSGWIALGVIAVVSTLVLAALIPEQRADHVVQTATIVDRIRGLEGSYALFGLGYISYATFVVAYVQDGDADVSTVLFWATLGAATVVGSFVWPSVFARFTAGAAYPVTLAVCASGVALIIIDRSTITALASATLFGFSALAVVSGVSAAARDRVRPESWGGVIGRLTAMFGVGQMLGPLLGGALGDTSTGLRLGLGASAAILAAGAVVAMADHRADVAA